MIHRSKPFRGIEERKLYKDCTYFDVIMEKKKYPDGEIREESVFVLTRFVKNLSEDKQKQDCYRSISLCHDPITVFFCHSINSNVYHYHYFFSGYSDKHFPTGVNFSSSSSKDLSIIVKSINALIYSVQGDIDISASARVYPLFCTHIEFENQCRAHDHEIATAQSQDNSETPTEYSSEEDDDAPHYIATSAVQITYPGKLNSLHRINSSEFPILNVDVEGKGDSVTELLAICINPPPIVVNARV